MVTDVYTKSNYDWLRIGKALAFRKSENNSNKPENKQSWWV